MKLRASAGKLHPADVTKEWDGDFEGFIKALIPKHVPVTEDKASAGWVCGVHFKPAYRHSENFVARHFLSLDYDHIKPTDIDLLRGTVCRGRAYLAYTTWSHTESDPRIRIWIPLSRGVNAEEFQAVSRAVAAVGGIELAARESHTPCQFMYRPTRKEGVEFQVWKDTASPYLDVDKVLGEYDDWTDRSQWPRRKEHDELFDTNDVGSPLDKPGLVGDFCRTFRITQAIDRFDLPYKPGSSEDRWTYTGGSRADGAVIYDDDTKLHSHHDTDPARGQHNAYDLVRLHRFAGLDVFDTDTPIEQRPSTGAMQEFCRGLPEFASLYSAGFTAIEDADEGGAGSVEEGVREGAYLPDEITRSTGLATDLENARRIQRAYGRQVIAVAGDFYVWQETHWKHDLHKGQIARKVAELSKLVKADAQSKRSKHEAEGTWDDAAAAEVAALYKFAVQCDNKAKMDACRELLRELLDHPAAQLNTHRQLLNARNCTVNLETGTTYNHRPEDFLTTCAPTDYDPAAKCDRFEAFMLEIFDGDREVVAFMKRWLGYCITGEVRAQALVFHIGKSGNGKSTLMNVMEHVLGGYAYMGPRSLLTGKGEIKNDVAQLIGRRMVTLNETKQNEEFDQAQLKDLSGGNTLSARFLHKEFFEFAPTHKLQIFTNHEPNLTGDDAGVWRRILLVRYPVRFGTKEQVESGEYQKLRDDTLEEALKLEAPGILRWLVEGAREWYAAGLAPPAAVLAATAHLRDEQDILGQFLKERTVRDPAGKVPWNQCTESLYGSYKGWIVENGHKAYGRTNFLRKVRDACPWVADCKWQDKGEWFRGFSGIRLRRDDEITG